LDNAPGSGAGCGAVGEELDELSPPPPPPPPPRVLVAAVRIPSGVLVVIPPRHTSPTRSKPINQSKTINQSTRQLPNNTNFFLCGEVMITTTNKPNQTKPRVNLNNKY
jgi:hypothetical protein